MRTRLALGFLVAVLPLLGGGLCGPTPDLPREAERCTPPFDLAVSLDPSLPEDDAGAPDASLPDGGPADASMPDASLSDGGRADGGRADGGRADGGRADAAIADGGPSETLVVEVGGLDGTGHFAAWQDDVGVPIIPGFQGGEMVGVYLRVPGARDACVQVHVAITADAKSGADLAPPPDAWYPAQLSVAEGGYQTSADGTTAAFLIRVDGIAWPLSLADVRLRIDARVASASAIGGRRVRITPLVR